MGNSIAFDAVLVAALARELEARLRGARLRALRLDRPGRVLALLFREGTLRFALHPEAGGVGWHEPIEPTPEDRPLSARLRAVEALADDRVLRLSFLRVRGSPPAVDVTVEWITKRWNAVVTEGPERVVRSVLVEMEGERAPRTGHPWIPPAPSLRAGIEGDLTLEAWRDRLAVPAEQRRRALLGIAWTSALNAGALLGGPRAGADAATADRALDAGHALWRELAGIAWSRREAAPVVLRTEPALQPYPLPLHGVESEPTPSLLEAFARAAAMAAPSAALLPTKLTDGLRERIVRAWGRVESLAGELAQAPDPDGLRRTGDLILARLGDITRGAARAALPGFEGTTVDVELDPQLAPHEQAPAYYERAARAERARARLPELIEKARGEARRLEALLERAVRGEATAEAVRAEVPASAETARGEAAPSLPYRVYRSSGGLEIRVGRGARHNDDLTFHHAAPDDVWLHARHAAGAHVVLRWKGEGNPPARDLAEAAVLAALNSKARTSGSVPVDWTRRKYVRKPRKSPPGQVLVERVKTLFVKPDPAVEERLREGGNP
jgi:predicted ribosome quality control (RQC) complex YloA/Tae2 family protein